MKFVAVCGGRRFGVYDKGYPMIYRKEIDLLDDVLDQEIRYDDVIVTGSATGADTCARTYAYNKGNQIIDIPALWNRHGKSAGFIRNAVIAELPLRLLIAFPGGNGTKHMIECAKKKGIEILEVKS